MPFREVPHQDAAQERLQRAMASGRVPHAYLFSGPDGVGREALATRFAALLLCENPQEVPPPDGASHLPAWREACGRCVECELMAADNHPDLHRIYRALNRHHPDKTVQKRKAIDLSVDVIRHFLVERIGVHPSRGRAKVFIIREADRLSRGAQNAMLKTLEEPPDHSYLILLATTPEALLPTTNSRCHHIPLHRLPVEYVSEQLMGQAGATNEEALFLAELSQGSLGTALRYREAALFDHLPEIIVSLERAGADPLGCGKRLADIAEALKAGLANTLPEGDSDTNAARQSQLAVLATTATVLRDIQRAAVGVAAAALSAETAIAQIAGRTSAEQVGQAIRALSLAEYEIGRSANKNLIFDRLGIQMGRHLHALATHA